MLGQWTVATARNFKHPSKGLFTDLFIYFTSYLDTNLNQCANAVLISVIPSFLVILQPLWGCLLEKWLKADFWYLSGGLLFESGITVHFLHTVNGFSTKWLKSKAKLDFGSRYYCEGKNTGKVEIFTICNLYYFWFITTQVSEQKQE